MGEAVVSSEGGGGGGCDGRRGLEAEEVTTGREGGVSASTSVVRWERFLPRMVLRVLLVEADDSTRQIIAALLRKCSYRVAAVADGLKAWEVLKGRPRSIDLILTEVELPSISGYALLTLIMEHEICKSIPVIMMSSQDSVSTVYKCMLRGASDFLVKPVRKNELRNLWQHVWRRQVQSNGDGLGQQDESVAQQKVEATAENNDASNHSSGYIACIQRNRECIEKGSDAQSSCTKPDLEADGTIADMREQPQPVEIDIRPKDVQPNATSISRMHNSEAKGSGVAAKDGCTAEKNNDSNTQTLQDDAIGQAPNTDHVAVNSSNGAIDLIGAFDNYLKYCYKSSCSNYCSNQGDLLPLLDLSLRRPHPSSSVNQVPDERQKLNHSDASAFSRYVNKAVQAQNSTSPSTCNPPKEFESNSGKQLSDQLHDNDSDTHGPVPSSQRSMHPFMSAHHGQNEIVFSPSQQVVFPVPVSARSIRIESLYTGYNSMVPPVICTKSGLSPVQSPGSAGYQGASYQVNSFPSSDPEMRSSQPYHHRFVEKNANAECEQTQNNQGLEHKESRGRFSSTTDQSASGSFCNGTTSNLNGIVCRSNGTVGPVPVVRVPMESGNEEGLFHHEGSIHRSAQREAALTKFRLKRKERCFEKKVRYESRKKLAEQRPRVKGQFVRQVHTEPPALPVSNTNCGSAPTG